MTTILVTGSTGTIGSRLVKALSGRSGVNLRAATRDPSKHTASSSNVQYVAFDLEKADSFAAALKGVDKVFSLIPATPRLVEQSRLLQQAARAAGVQHIVELSGEFAETVPEIPFGAWHREAEQLLESSGIPFTILRPTIFMSDFATFFAPQPDGNIYLPVGQAATAAVDPLDVAEVAAVALTREGHQGKRYRLTGAEALTVSQVASRISETTGRQVKHVDVPPDTTRAALEKLGAPAWQIDATLTLLAAMKDGKTATTTSVVREVTGHPPRSFAQFARDNAAAWKK